jgi:hypothetical protein
MHVELESSMGDSFASLVVGTSDDPLGVTGGMQAAGVSGVANERECSVHYERTPDLGNGWRWRTTT